MKKFFALLLFLLSFCAAQSACSAKLSDEEKAKDILSAAIMQPEQAFTGSKTLYVKSVQTSKMAEVFDIFKTSSSDGEDLFENKMITEIYFSGEKFRVSSYGSMMSFKTEMHIIFDGKTLTTITDFAPKEQNVLNKEEAEAMKNMIGGSGMSLLAQVTDHLRDELCQFRLLKDSDVNGVKCNVVEVTLKNGPQETEPGNGDNAANAVYYVDPKTRIVMKVEMPWYMGMIAEVKKTAKIKGKHIPVSVEIKAGEMYLVNIEYEVKVNAKISDLIFDESQLLVPVKKMYMGNNAAAPSAQEMIKNISGGLVDLAVAMNETDLQKQLDPESFNDETAEEFEKSMKELSEEMNKSIEKLKKSMEEISKTQKESQEELMRIIEKMTPEERELFEQKKKKMMEEFSQLVQQAAQE